MVFIKSPLIIPALSAGESSNAEITSMDKNLLDKHYLRKHGANAYYGQK